MRLFADALLPDRPLAAGQSFQVAVDAGTALFAAQGRLRVDAAPRWLADVIVPVGCTLDEGEGWVVERAGWITVSALGGAPARLRFAPAGRGWRLALPRALHGGRFRAAG